MLEVRKGKPVDAETSIISKPKNRPTSQKRKRSTEVQKLIETTGAEQKTNWTDKDTGNVYSRREKGFPIAEEKRTRAKGAKHKKFKNPAVVAKDTKEDKAVAPEDKSTSKVMQFQVVQSQLFIFCMCLQWYSLIR